ncbi:MAG: RidA family protein [Rhizobiales bacterium]|nr:RidA family protein [Hyphomicrobiales bacterium]MBI3674205.1 RidA family protein [Hyphomicrobiales bacterium]
MSAEQRLRERGIILPTAPTPKGNYVPGVIHNGLLYLSGQGPVLPEGGYATGIVGRDVSLDQAYSHARLTGLALLATARDMLGSLDRIERVLNVFGMVNAAPDFIDQPKVINGFSDLMVEVFGEAGRHARAAVGMGSLPMRISVEITVIMAVRA